MNFQIEFGIIRKIYFGLKNKIGNNLFSARKIVGRSGHSQRQLQILLLVENVIGREFYILNLANYGGGHWTLRSLPKWKDVGEI